MDKMCRKYAPKLVPDPFLNLVNNPKQPWHSRNYFENKMIEGYQKTFKKLTLFFLLNPGPFNGQNYQKQKGLGN